MAEADLPAYYARRAPEYERVYAKPERQAELRALETWLADQAAGRHGWELACGTGWWTVHAAARCASWLATDVNDEVLAIARAKPLAPDAERRVRFACADALARPLAAPAACDFVFAGFWWSHLRREALAGWLNTLQAALGAGARCAFVDNAYVEGSSTPIARRDAAGNTWQRRRLDDGSAHEVLKNFPTRDEALAALGPRAREPRWREWGHYWTLDYTLD